MLRLSPRERAQIPEPRGGLQTAGDAVVFTGRAVAELRRATRYAPEVLRQAALIATGSMLVIVAIAFFAGGSCGLESSSLARAFGASSIAGGFSSWCTLREVSPFVFGYILAAKVGCGMVAELGAMRVDEEIDAIEAIGVRSLAWLVGTRVLACAAILPIAYLIALASAEAAAYVMSVFRFGDVSTGTWQLFFFNFQDSWDLVFSLVKGLVISAFVVAVSVYFGYNVRGGPAEVGLATARAMAVNVVGITVISAIGTLIFWGANPRLPLG
jgi:phospholipid/cholesterol/gamma-HCH transport system permease protein